MIPKPGQSDEYDRDLEESDHEFPTFRLRTTGRHTIFISTGSTLEAAMLDRPVAELLKIGVDRYARRFPYHRTRRGIIITSCLWERDKSLHKNPLIAVGGPAVNSLTEIIVSQGDELWHNDDRTMFLHRRNVTSVYQLAVWGVNARDTLGAAQALLQDEERCREFANAVWNH